MLKYAYNNQYDTAILVSGDGDFAEAIEAVRDLGKYVEHAYFDTAKTEALKKACNKHIPLNQSALRTCFLD